MNNYEEFQVLEAEFLEPEVMRKLFEVWEICSEELLYRKRVVVFYIRQFEKRKEMLRPKNKLKPAPAIVPVLESMEHYIYAFLDGKDVINCTVTCTSLQDDKKWKFTKNQKHQLVSKALRGKEAMKQASKLYKMTCRDLDFTYNWIDALENVKYALSYQHKRDVWHTATELRKFKSYLVALDRFGATPNCVQKLCIHDWFSTAFSRPIGFFVYNVNEDLWKTNGYPSDRYFEWLCNDDLIPPGYQFFRDFRIFF